MAKKHFNKKYPFFAYGIFKPGQLAFSKIEKYVDKIVYSKINYKMLIRDGVPIIEAEKHANSKTYGYLIDFKDEFINDAYGIINQSEPDELYYWEVITTADGSKCNVLKGIDPQSGSNEMEFGINGEFHGQNDPLFREALELVDNSLNINLHGISPIDEFKVNIKEFFILQMHYMLLWTAIDRFLSLRYNMEYKNDNNFEISQEDFFEDIFKRHLGKYGRCPKRRKIFNTENLRHRIINSDVTPDWAMNYYYAVRCNVVHRGKTVSDDQNHLKCSLIELSHIFEDILKVTFNIVTIDGIDFCIPYGLKEITNKNDSTRIFKRDENNSIEGIPNYTIEISLDSENGDNIYSIDDKKIFNIKIINAEEGKISNIIGHLNKELRKERLN